MSNVQPSPQPGPSPSTKTSDSGSGGFFGKIADVADFLFGAKSIGRLLTGEGGWGDLANVGITAASFFIPPVRLLKFAPHALESIVVHAAEVAASDGASVAAKNAAARTAENAKYLLDHPDVHDNLIHLSQTDNTLDMSQLSHLPSEADHFIKTGTVPEKPVQRVGDTYEAPTEPVVSEDLKASMKAHQESETTKTIDERIASGEEHDAPKLEAPALNPESDAAKYPNLTEEELAMHRADGLSETQIKAWDEWEGKQNAGKLPDTIEKKSTELTPAEQNRLDTVNAEFPVTPEGKPITRRMEDSMPEDMRTGNLKVDRTAWLISESKKLENFLKKKPNNAGEIRATKDLWNKKANELQLKMDPDERIQANELANQLTERSLADYVAGKETLQRGVVDFDVSKETNLSKLTNTRTKLIDEWRAETNPDLKKAIAVTGKKVAARIDELNSSIDKDYGLSYLKNIQNNGKVVIAVDSHSLPDIIKSGEFKSRHELDLNIDNSYLEKRNSTEKLLSSKNNDSQKPIYGFVATDLNQVKASSLDSFGDLRIVLKSHVKEKTFFTVGDSFRGSQKSIPLTKKISDEKMLTSIPKEMKTKKDLLENEYIEAQIFDKISLDDIDTIYYTGLDRHYNNMERFGVDPMKNEEIESILKTLSEKYNIKIIKMEGK